ncbi:uncharacterized protein BDZ99DRAFT_434170 [Mytilinidion resinicola]|uniref:Integral membrane protein n=1 Tax=Mytilinidion resinicola TaxID=574789 RepID=A0A6A6Z910_9PEZI|nr:uncharacterized protein BDZ99DRAFT_434170 [Mytilinidion resinicola]KAF2816697.1 hypothetical protein BDZ99DRAFT_434170 [Mytilinidion resinicola]
MADRRPSSQDEPSRRDHAPSISVHPPSSTTTTTTTTTSSDPRSSNTVTTTSGPRNTTTSSNGLSTTTTTTTTGPTFTSIVPRRPAPLQPSLSSTPQRPTVSRAGSGFRLRRLASSNSLYQQPVRSSANVPQTQQHDTNDGPSNRRRSSSEPQRPQLSALADDLAIRRQMTAQSNYLSPVQEDGSAHPSNSENLSVPPIAPSGSRRRASTSARNILHRLPSGTNMLAASGQDHQEYDSNIIDMLDVIDPEVATLTTLNNVQNSLFIPNLGSFYRRQPTYDLSRHSTDSDSSTDEDIGVAHGEPPHNFLQGIEGIASQDQAYDEEKDPQRPYLNRYESSATISSVLTSLEEGHNYAVLPHGASLEGWSAEDKAELNDHVRHLLHSRRAAFKRGMRGFGKYVQKPVGFFVTLYAFLLTFWGAAWVLFIIGWISVGDRQAYFIEICDQILTALFCVVGIGFAPFRAVDTYHMIFIARYAHLTWKLRKQRALPELRDHNELPTLPDSNRDIENQSVIDKSDEDPEGIVLTEEQQRKLEYHQGKFAKSHTFYKPHETFTHRAFSLRLLITIVVLLDCHSCFQMALGGTTWGIYYKDRPKALTAVILTCSICCNISAGITITVGDRRSRKKMVVEQMFRQGLTEEALKKLRKEKGLKAKGVKVGKKERKEERKRREKARKEQGRVGEGEEEGGEK